MKIEGVAGHAQNAHALGRQQAPERPQPGKTTGGNTDMSLTHDMTAVGTM